MSLVRHIFLKLSGNDVRRVAAASLHSIKPFKVQDSSLVRKYEDSFQHWILSMFRTHPNYTVIEQKPMKTESVRDEDIKTLDLVALLNLLWSKKAEEALTPLALRKIDDVLSARITYRTSTENLLSCLHRYMTDIPIQAPKLKAFRHALIQLESRIKKSSLSAHELVQAMYYASHLKTGLVAKKFMPVAVYHLDTDKLKKLSNADLGVMCVSLFRSSVPLEKPDLLQFLVERFKQEIDSLITKEPAIFVSFVKCFRISKYYEDDMMNFIASQGQNSFLKLDIVARIHLGVYLSASNYGNVEFMNAYLTSCIEELNKKIVDGKTQRLKDIDNLLWSCSVYNTEHLCNQLQHSEVVKYVKGSLCLLKNDSNAQISILLWLWICGCRFEQEVSTYVTPDRVKYITESKNFKGRANLFLLLTCVNLESPGLLKPHIIGARNKRLQPKFEPYVNKRPCMKALLTELQKNCAFLKLENVRFDFLVPALYIGSIYTEFKGSPLSIEVIDPSVCLLNSNQLKGRMILKLRLLKKMGVPYLQIPGNTSYDIDDLRIRLQEHKNE